VVSLLAASSLFAQTNADGPDEGFDKPVRKTVVDLGPSPYYMPARHVRKRLMCYHYSSFTVKEYDEGQKGAEWLSVVPSANTACTLKRSEGEIILEWPEGYFWGAAGKYAIFVAADGVDGGLPFAVFDASTGRKLFEDSVLNGYVQNALKIKNAFRIRAEAEQAPKFTYLRVVRTDCNINAAQSDCWPKVRKEYGIVQTDIPVCSGYQQADWESAVEYPVSILLTDSPHFEAIEGPVFCWPTS